MVLAVLWSSLKLRWLQDFNRDVRIRFNDRYCSPFKLASAYPS